MVVIKGVKTFHNSVTVEYSDLDIMQMLGRAVRPSSWPTTLRLTLIYMR